MMFYSNYVNRTAGNSLTVFLFVDHYLRILLFFVIFNFFESIININNKWHTETEHLKNKDDKKS